MFGLNGWEWVIILVVLLLLFGQRLPSVMRSMGKSVTEFKKGMNEIDEEPAARQKKAEKDPDQGDGKPAG
jgi:sec-independent protein translocase protein TatA